MTSSGFGEPQPLIVWPNTTQFILPEDSSGIIKFGIGEKIELICPNKFFTPKTNERNILVQCYSGTNFLFKNEIINIKEINCTHHPRYVLRETEQNCGNNSEIIIQIGYEFELRYFWLMDVCHDLKLDSTLYSYYHLSPGSQGYQRSVKRPNFSQNGYFIGLNVKFLYTEMNQRAIFTNLLQSQSIVDELISRRKKTTLTRGHLAAKVDFILGSHQRATHHYINTAPQWFGLNSGNWLKIEDGIRKLVSKRNIHIDIYSGTYGIMKMADYNGTDHEIYLNIDNNNEKHIPTPLFFYRILYHPATLSGIALISVNDPFISIGEIRKKYILCEDVSSTIDWLKWKPRDLSTGYSYACNVLEFSKAINRHQDIIVNQLFI